MQLVNLKKKKNLFQIILILSILEHPVACSVYPHFSHIFNSYSSPSTIVNHFGIFYLYTSIGVFPSKT